MGKTLALTQVTTNRNMSKYEDNKSRNIASSFTETESNKAKHATQQKLHHSARCRPSQVMK